MTNIITGNSKGELKGEDKVDRYIAYPQHMVCLQRIAKAWCSTFVAHIMNLLCPSGNTHQKRIHFPISVVKAFMLRLNGRMEVLFMMSNLMGRALVLAPLSML